MDKDWELSSHDKIFNLFKEAFDYILTDEEINKLLTHKLTENNMNIPIGFSKDYQKGYKDGQSDANAIHVLHEINIEKEAIKKAEQ